MYYKPGVQSFKILKHIKCVMNIFNTCVNTSDLKPNAEEVVWAWESCLK